MLFNSWEFLALLLVLLPVYYLPSLRRWQVYVLLAGGFVFYAFDSPRMLLLLICSALVNAFASYGARWGRRQRLSATVGVVVNLLLLAVFKYGGMISETFLDVNSGIGHLMCRLPLPLGISFYTFSGISLVVDAYRGRSAGDGAGAKPRLWRHVRDTLLYITFFPKLISGPIAKSRGFFGDIGEKHFQSIDWQFVFKALVTGFFLKMVIADNLKDFTFWMPFRYSCYFGSGSLLTLALGYSVQIFADFAGYSLIAIGVASLFGYRLPDNFLFPYVSASFREFWKRWHITLSQFLMEYLYISLGGNRKGKARTYVNLLLTMTLGGLWHGAAWCFVGWGVYHGLCLVVERMVCGRRDNCIQLGSSPLLMRLSRLSSMLFVFLMVTVGWLLFRMSLGEAVHFVVAIGGNLGGGMPFFDMRFFPVLVYMLPVAAYHALYLLRDKAWARRYVLRYDYVLYGLMLFLLLTNSGSPNQFVYFQF